MKIFTFLFCLSLMLYACKKGDLKAPVIKPCSDTLQHNVISVSGPTSVAVNQDAIFNVSWRALNACDTFVAFKQDTLENTIAIKTIAAHDSCSLCVAPTLFNKIAPYKFRSLLKGIYYLKFYRSSKDTTAAIIDTITIH